LAVRSPDADGRLLLATVGGGALFGVGLAALRAVHCPKRRLIYSLLAGIAAVAAGILVLEYYPDLVPEADRRTLGVFLLLGLPFFYLLTFAGEAEESEVEVAAWCAALALGIWLIKLTTTVPLLALAFPALLYYGYSRYVMPGLRVFKHTLRGMSYSRLGRYRPALASLRRAVQLDPANRLAREALWDVHRDLDASQIAADPELVRMVDPDLCLERAGSILAESPTPEKRAEAIHLLELVEGQSPARAAKALYWRAVAATHAKDFDAAEAALAPLLDPARWPADDPSRQAIAFRPGNWRRRCIRVEAPRRRPATQTPGRRLDAIAAAERALVAAPDDSDAWGLKRVLYSELTQADYDAGPIEAFDHAYAEQLGLALVGDPARWSRGVEYLRIAACGLAERTPSIYAAIGKALEQHGDADAARAAYESGKRAGLTFGPKQFADDQRLTYSASSNGWPRTPWPAKTGRPRPRTIRCTRCPSAAASRRTARSPICSRSKAMHSLRCASSNRRSCTPPRTAPVGAARPLLLLGDARATASRARRRSERLRREYCLQKRGKRSTAATSISTCSTGRSTRELALVLKPESLAAKSSWAVRDYGAASATKPWRSWKPCGRRSPSRSPTATTRSVLCDVPPSRPTCTCASWTSRTWPCSASRVPGEFQERGRHAVQAGAGVRATRRIEACGQVLRAGDGLR